MKPYFCFSCMGFKSDFDFKKIGSLEVCKKCYEENKPTYGSYGSTNYGQIIDSYGAIFLFSCFIIVIGSIISIFLIST